jgi:hypothetical protein
MNNELIENIIDLKYFKTSNFLVRHSSHINFLIFNHGFLNVKNQQKHIIKELD